MSFDDHETCRRCGAPDNGHTPAECERRIAARKVQPAPVAPVGQPHQCIAEGLLILGGCPVDSARARVIYGTASVCAVEGTLYVVRHAERAALDASAKERLGALGWRETTAGWRWERWS